MLKVSVIIPVYNMANYLRECLDVVCTQTLDDYEVICVDDCSPDNSYEVLMECSAKYPCLKVYKQPENMGAGPARNVGLKNATGEFVAFMDADDSYPDSNTLKMMYDTAKEKDALIVGGGLRYTGENAENMQKQIEQNSFAEEGWLEYKDYQEYYYYQRFLFNREMLERNNINFPHYLRFQDPPFFVRAMLAAERLYVLTEPTYVYRNDAGHVKWTDPKVSDYMRGVKDLIGFGVEYGLDKIYAEMMSRFTSPKKRFSQQILEASLLRGNDDVRDFYKFIVETYKPELLPEGTDVDMDYARSIARWDGVRGMVMNHRDINLVDAAEEVKPLVSVIVPVYNTEDYIEGCVGSITAQTLRDIEIICIDDGSADASGDLLEKIKEADSRVKVYHQHNQGLSAARNAGLQHVQGKYVYFMDSDDFLEPDALENLYIRAEKDQLDVLFFGAESFFDEEVTEEDKEKIHLPMLYSRCGQYPDFTSGQEMLVMQEKNSEYYTSVCIQFYRTDYLRENKLAFFEGLLHEDNLFTMTSTLLAGRVGCTPETYFKRRIRKNSIMTSTVSHRNVIGYFLTYMELKRAFDGADISEEARDVLNSKMQDIIRNAICYKWSVLNNAEKALTRATLTKNDLDTFELFAMLQDNSQAQRDRVQYLLNENSRIRSRLEASWAEITRQKEMNETKRERIQKLFDEISRQKKMNSEKQERIRTLLDEISRQKNMNSQKQERIKTLFDEISRQKKMNTDKQERVKTLLGEVARQKEMNTNKQERIRIQNDELARQKKINSSFKKRLEGGITPRRLWNFAKRCVRKLLRCAKACVKKVIGIFR